LPGPLRVSAVFWHLSTGPLCHGTTSIVPTTITSTKASLLEFIQLFNQVELTRPDMPNILGLHLEGPYFAYEQRGAQDPKYLRAPDEREYKEVLSKTNRIRRWSFAVELDGAERFLRTLQDHGIVSSLAHSNATTEQVFRAYENGMRALTHFYSGMSGVRRIDAFRVGGAIEAGYLLDDLFVEVIADGCHLPKELLQLIYKVKGADRICLVTDSMRGAGMPDGHYVLGNKNTGLDTIVEDGVAKLPDRCSFAGSVATSDRLVRTFRNLTSAPLYEVVRMASLTPAKLLGISHQTGSIANGKKADLIIFDEHISVSFVMVNGRPLIA
ncbi:N-acetylglucosamine-6-phosphate deacetylase, partial [Ruthenibacterium lactatiformans]|uniref:N-acetylglucosamine-6-phosphate deacetylase n=1 Tax=Ruthenibacterium lactatiformans TaxID=1550024 RepID=UPI0019675A5F